MVINLNTTHHPGVNNIIKTESAVQHVHQTCCFKAFSKLEYKIILR